MGHHGAERTAIRGMIPRGARGAVIALTLLAAGAGTTLSCSRAAFAQSVGAQSAGSQSAGSQSAPVQPSSAPSTSAPSASPAAVSGSVAPASPPPDSADPIRVRPPSLGELVVTPNFAPSYEEQREFHQSEYDRLRQRYVPPPDAQPSRTERLLGQPETLSTGSLPPANPLLDQRGAIPHEITVNNGGELTTGGPQPPPPPQQK